MVSPADLNEDGTGATISWPLFAQDFQFEQSALHTLTGWVNALYPYEKNAVAMGADVVVGAEERLFGRRK